MGSSLGLLCAFVIFWSVAIRIRLKWFRALSLVIVSGVKWLKIIGNMILIFRFSEPVRLLV